VSVPTRGIDLVSLAIPQRDEHVLREFAEVVDEIKKSAEPEVILRET